MNDINQDALAAPEVQDTTVIEEDVSGGPAPAHKEPESRDDAISKALDDAEAAAKVDGEDDDGVAAPTKAAKAPKEEAEADDADTDAEEGDDDAEAEAQPKPKQEKKPARPSIPAPEKFDAAAKEHWPSVPHVVRADIQRVINEYEGEAQYMRPAAERYNAIREYDEIAASNGIDLRQTLAEVKHLEDMMEANPLAAVNQILLRSGPRKPDGQPFSLFEMADIIVKMGPDGYHRAITHKPQAQQQQQQVDPQVQQLRTELQEMKAEQTRSAVIGPFAAQNPRFNEPEVQKSIAQLLRSDMIDRSLPVNERLEAAYNMAVRLNPSADDYAATVDDTQQATPRRVDGNGGSRSVKGAPPSGGNKGSAKRVLSRDDAISAAMAALR